MRILICSFTFWPQANGVAEVVREQSIGLLARGHEVTIATGFDPLRASVERIPGITVREFKIPRLYRPGTGHLDAVEDYQDYLTTTDADVVFFHCWECWPTDLAWPVLARCPARKVLVSHGYPSHIWNRQPRFPWGWGQWLRKQPVVWWLPRQLRSLDHIVFLSRRLDFGRFFDHWVLNRVGGPAWSVIPNGTWPEKFAERGLDFRALHHLENRFLILKVSLYAPNKNQEAALRAFSASRISDATLVFIGNELNDYSRHLQQLVSRLEFGPGSSVLFLEKQNREHIRAAYQAADLVMLTSKGECQPLVLLDAMACGKPFLSTDVGCVSELPGGLAVRGSDALAGNLRLLRNDATRRQALGRLGLAAARSTYYWPEVITAYDRLIRQLAIPVTRIQP